MFGGTFDPIHVGHLVAAVNARYAAGLDLVLMVVANQPWQKLPTRTITPARDRYALVEAAVAGVEGLEASSLEIDRGGISYTADTLAELSTTYPGTELHLVVGSDLMRELHTWERVEEVVKRATLLVVNRPGAEWAKEDHPGLPMRVLEVRIPALEISSTDLRQRAANGRPLDFLVPDTAIRWIRQRGLYATDG
ncbi:MAG: nicotinate-nucleotide adenylyltransferase [Acidimicrobiales bacterium]|nr:nicotinate-nucleotide adenylyltransferase [Acidimicrobiales bacterium]